MNTIDKLDKIIELFEENGIVTTESRTIPNNSYSKYPIRLFLKDNIDGDVCDAVNYLNDNYKNFTKEDWFNFYEKHKNQPEVLVFMLNNKETPSEIANQIILNTKTVKEKIADEWTRPSYDTELIQKGFAFDIPKSTINKVVDFMDVYSPFGAVNIFTMYITPYADSYHDNVIKYLCDKVIEFEPTEYRGSMYGLLSYIKDKDYIINLINKDDIELNEFMVSSLINNIYFDPQNKDDEEIMNKLFDLGCDYDHIKNFTNRMKHECSKFASERMNDAISVATGSIHTPTIFADAKNTIMHLLNRNAFELCYRRDLSEKLPYMEKPLAEWLINVFYENETDPDIFRTIDNFKGKDKVNLYLESKNIPEDMIVNFACENYMKKMMKHLSSNKEYKVPNIWFEYMKTFVQKATFPEEVYNFFIYEHQHSDILNAIVASSKTPNDVLETIAKELNDGLEYLYRYNLLSIQARLNLYCRENDISSTQFNYLVQAINSPPSLVSDETYNSYWKLISDYKIYTNFTIAFSKLLENSNTEELEKINNFFKQVLSNPNLNNNDKYICTLLNKLLTDKIKDRIQEEKGISFYDNKKLVNAIIELFDKPICSQILYKESDYVEINKVINTFFELLDEAKKRNFDILKEISEIQKEEIIYNNEEISR